MNIKKYNCIIKIKFFIITMLFIKLNFIFSQEENQQMEYAYI